MIVIDNIAMNYGAKLLFADSSMNLNPGFRYGLVGANGAGKSTLLRLILGEEIPSLGEVIIKKGSRVGAMKQDQYLYDDELIINTVIAGKEELYNAIKEKDILLEKQDLSDDEGMRLAELEHIILENDGYTAEIEAAKILSGLGISEEKFYDKMSSLSGGYKLRVLLAQSLFNNPEVLLLDEPTNHLDIITIYWLEQFLKETYKGVLIFISHDVGFLNNLSTHIIDIDYGEIRLYTGNYDKFCKEKLEVSEQKLKQMEYVQKKLEHMQSIADKFRAGTRARQSKSIEKRMDRIELPELSKSSRLSPYFRFQQNRPSGKLALKVDGISKSFGEKNILKNIDLSISRGEKLVIVGENGAGKSTLLKILVGKLKQDLGNFEWGIETYISYFAQDHHEEINGDCSVYEWLEERFPSETNQKLRAVLGQVLFKSDEISKSVSAISGGEAARLLLGKIILEKANILIFDEPTNHMDIETKDALAEALNNFEGTLILVSHDRDFVSKIATRVVSISNKKFIDYKGSYNEFIEKYKEDYLLRN